MADGLRIGLEELLRKARMEQDTDFLREGVRVLSQELMEMEVSDQLGAAKHERTEGRKGYRNGYRTREWDTRVGTVELAVPKVRDGSYYPSLLEPKARVRRGLLWRWYRRRMSREYRPGGWMNWSNRWG